jgi:hypothetical protein
MKKRSRRKNDLKVIGNEIRLNGQVVTIHLSKIIIG